MTDTGMHLTHAVRGEDSGEALPQPQRAGAEGPREGTDGRGTGADPSHPAGGALLSRARVCTEDTGRTFQWNERLNFKLRFDWICH